MRRRITIVAAAATLTTAGMAVASSAAQAAASDCDGPRLCVWVDAQYKGRMEKVGDSPTLGTMDKKISSVWNRTDQVVCLYPKRHFKGRKARVVRPGAAVANLGPFNDRISSIKVGGCNA